MKKRGTIKLKDPNGVKIDPKDTAECFNDYFTTIAEKLKTKIGLHNSNHTVNLKDKVMDSMYIHDTSSDEILKHISSLKTKSTSDTKVSALKTASGVMEFNYTLSDVINCSFNNGIFPNQLKVAKVVPIHKNGKNRRYPITDPFHYSLYSRRFSKRRCTREFMIIYS